MRVCVYAASSDYAPADYTDEARRLGVLLAQAGTGTGKSIAYLAAAAAHAAASGERAIISTGSRVSRRP